MNKIAMRGLGRTGRAALTTWVKHPEAEIMAVNDSVLTDDLAY